MILFHTANLPHYGLERIFDIAQKAGFEGIEVEVNSMYDTQNVEYLKSLETRFGLPIKAFSLSSKQEEDLNEIFQEVVKHFPGVTLNLNSPKNFSFGYKNWINDIVPRLSQKYELTFCRRNSPFKAMFGVLPSRAENSIFALKQAGKVCLDLTALALSSEDIMRAVSALGNQMEHVYLSNVYKNRPYSLPQKGILPLESFLTKLAQMNYQGNFTLRVLPKNTFEGDDAKMLEVLKEAREFYGQYFK